MTTRLLSILSALLVVVAILLAGCSRFDAETAPGPRTDTTPTVRTDDVRAHQTQTYKVQGRVIERLSDGQSLLVEHAPIEDVMPGMTMAFAARRPASIDHVEVGNAVAFRYHVGHRETWIDGVEVLADEAVAEPPSQSQPPERIAPAVRSLYQHDAVWTTQDAAQISLLDFQGRPVILAMVFTHCRYACPLIVRDMRAVAKALPETMQVDLQHVLISIDPARDTPAVLSRFAEAHALSPSKWTLLRGNPGDVRTLAALLGVRYKPDGNGQFAHTNLITFLDANGEIIHQQEGLGTDPADSAGALRAALDAQP